MEQKYKERFLRENHIREMVPASRSTIWRWEKQGRFPRRRRLGPGVVGWIESEVLEWIRTRETVRADLAEARK